MAKTIFQAHAKLNLSLNLLPERGDRGYFKVRFLNIQVALSDVVNIETSRTPGIHAKYPVVDGPENIALRAAEAVVKGYGIEDGVEIDIEKHIPLRAGLGGGSADAAAVINGMNSLFHLGLGPAEKVGIALNLGMDVCYCVVGGLCRVGGIGERVEPVSHPMPTLDLVIATPGQQKPSTAWAYSLLRDEEVGAHLDRYEQLLRAIEERDPGSIAAHLHNDFEAPISSRYPVVGEIRKAMLDAGASGALLAGSGLSVFGVFQTREDAEGAHRRLTERGISCIVTHSLP
jgi:4-diphosphocytidyl-2-C-methyl-D-erythritol kinase